MHRNALSSLPFFALSGPRWSYRSNVFAALPSALQQAFPNVDFVFCSPFDPELTCPLLFSEQEWAEHPTTRLIGDWVQLDRGGHKIREIRKRGSIVVSLGFGLDAVLHSAVMPDYKIDDENINEVFRVQGGMVGVRLDEQDLPAPFYFVMELDAKSISSRMAAASPQLEAVPHETRLKFIDYEHELIKRYKERVPHQTGFQHVDCSTGNVTEMISQIIPTVRGQIREWQKAAA